MMKQNLYKINLEILRTVAAVTVVLYHFTGALAPCFDPHNPIGYFGKNVYQFPGHLCVLVFFFLSGYVIELSTKRLSDSADIKSYIKKRLVRLVPIYWISLFLTLLVCGGTSVGQVLANFFCISVPLNSVFLQNVPLWSLHYELLYYMLFIFVSAFFVDLTKLLRIAIVLAAALFVVDQFYLLQPLPISYLLGFLFWIAGAEIAHRSKKNAPGLQLSHTRLIALMLMLFYMEQINPMDWLFSKFHLQSGVVKSLSWFQQSIIYRDVFYFPYCMVLLSALSKTPTKLKRYADIVVYAIFLLGFVVLYPHLILGVVRLHRLDSVAILCALHFLTVVLWVANRNVPYAIKERIKSTHKVGAITYALYIIHAPLIFIWGRYTSSSTMEFVVKLVAYFVVVAGLSWVLELKMQPYLRRLLLKPAAKPAVPAAQPEVVESTL